MIKNLQIYVIKKKVVSFLKIMIVLLNVIRKILKECLCIMKYLILVIKKYFKKDCY